MFTTSRREHGKKNKREHAEPSDPRLSLFFLVGPQLGFWVQLACQISPAYYALALLDSNLGDFDSLKNIYIYKYKKKKESFSVV